MAVLSAQVLVPSLVGNNIAGLREEKTSETLTRSLQVAPLGHFRKHEGLKLEQSLQGGNQKLWIGTSHGCCRVHGGKGWETAGSCWNASLGGAGVADEREREDTSDFPSVPSGTMMVPFMKKGFGAYGGGGATLEKSKLDLSSASVKTSPQIEMGGGGRGNDNRIHHGGGDGGDDGGDDDDYMGGDADDEGDDENGILRKVGILELFDRETVEAVLQEWFKTMSDLPAGLRRAMEMGLISSAQLVRFMSVDARPTIARFVSRFLPQELSRPFIGRMIADPAFLYKIVAEQVITIGSGVWWEVKHRGERLKDEWDLAAANVLTLAVCNLAIVWSISASRSYTTTGKYDWQRMLQKLPNHVFDKSYPNFEYKLAQRVSSFFYKAAELSLIGTVAGGALGGLSNALVGVKTKSNPEYSPSVAVPSTSTSALAFGAFMGLSSNLRYQLLYGADRAMFQNLNYLSLAIFGTTALRTLNVCLGEPSRLAWLGVDSDSATQTEAEKQAYRRPSLSGVVGGREFSLPTFTILKSFSLPTLDDLPFRNKDAKKEGAPSSNQSPSRNGRKPSRRKVNRKVSMAQ